MSDAEQHECSDAGLACRVRLGQIDAFRLVFRRHLPEVIALCHRVLADRQEAEDVASEVFFELWDKRERYDSGRSELRTYLLLLARSRAIDRYRTRSVSRQQVVQSNSTLDRDLSQLSPGDGPQELTVRAELAQLARDRLKCLGDRQREVLELVFYRDMSHTQVAVHLNLPLGTVKSDVRRGLAKLRDAMGGRQVGGAEC